MTAFKGQYQQQQQQHLFICTLSNKITIYNFFIIIVEYWLPEITIGARRDRQPVIPKWNTVIDLNIYTIFSEQTFLSELQEHLVLVQLKGVIDNEFLYDCESANCRLLVSFLSLILVAF